MIVMRLCSTAGLIVIRIDEVRLRSGEMVVVESE